MIQAWKARCCLGPDPSRYQAENETEGEAGISQVVVPSAFFLFWLSAA